MIDAELFPYPIAHEMEWNGMDTLKCKECDREKIFLSDGSLVTINEGDASAPHFSYHAEMLNLTAEML